MYYYVIGYLVIGILYWCTRFVKYSDPKTRFEYGLNMIPTIGERIADAIVSIFLWPLVMLLKILSKFA